MPEMDTCVEQLLHRDNGHKCGFSLGWCSVSGGARQQGATVGCRTRVSAVGGQARADWRNPQGQGTRHRRTSGATGRWRPQRRLLGDPHPARITDAATSPLGDAAPVTRHAAFDLAVVVKAADSVTTASDFVTAAGDGAVLGVSAASWRSPMRGMANLWGSMTSRTPATSSSTPSGRSGPSGTNTALPPVSCTPPSKAPGSR